jgi:hypothetical protein
MKSPSLSAEDILIVAEVMRFRSYEEVARLLGWPPERVKIRFAKLIEMMPDQFSGPMRNVYDVLG